MATQYHFTAGAAHVRDFNALIERLTPKFQNNRWALDLRSSPRSALFRWETSRHDSISIRVETTCIIRVEFTRFRPNTGFVKSIVWRGGFKAVETGLAAWLDAGGVLQEVLLEEVTLHGYTLPKVVNS